MTHTPPQWGAQPQPHTHRPPLPTTRPRRGITILTHLAVAFVALILGIAIGAAGASSSTDASTDNTAESGNSSDGADSKDSTPADDNTAEEEDTAEGTIPGDGTYLVGEDIQPGTYRGEGTSDYTCYWARLAGTSGEFDDIIANGTPTGSVVVTIEETDVAFETTGCSDWTLTE